MKCLVTWLVILAMWVGLSAESHAHTLQEKPLTADEYCMAVNIYYEARFEPNDGMYGVGFVTMNRALHRHQNVCHVVFAYRQFSWVLKMNALDEHGHLKQGFRPRERNPQWIVCKTVARDVLRHPSYDFTHGAEFFVANYIYPRCLMHSCRWSRDMIYVGQYGAHLFFATQAAYRRQSWKQ